MGEKQDLGVTPSGSGCQPPASAASADAPPSSQSGIPNAIYAVSVALSGNTPHGLEHSITQSWALGPRDSAVVHALEFALKEKPRLNIEQWVVSEIPLPLISIDDGARTAPRYAAAILRKLEPGRSGLIYNLDRLADHLDACAASGIEAATAGETHSGSTEGESAVPEADAQGKQP